MLRTIRRKNNNGGSLAEFGPILWVFFILIVFPIIDLASFLCGVAIVMFIASTAVHQAAPANCFSNAKLAVASAATQASSLRCFTSIAAHDPATDGTTLVCLMTNVTSSTDSPPTSYNVGAAIPVDTASNTYQYCVTASYDILPIFNFSGIPLLCDIPGLGKAVPISFSATAHVEHPEGLNN